MMILQRIQLLSTTVLLSSNNSYVCMVLDKHLRISGLNLVTILNRDMVFVISKVELNGTNMRKITIHVMNIIVNFTPNSGRVASIDHTSVVCSLGR